MYAIFANPDESDPRLTVLEFESDEAHHRFTLKAEAVHRLLLMLQQIEREMPAEDRPE